MRHIKLFSTELSSVQDRKFGWVAMPIIPIKLDYEVGSLNEGVYAKFASYEVLPTMRNRKLVENAIPNLL